MKKGFSLIELLVVIGIIAVLAAASMVAYSGIIRKAQDAKCRELVFNVQTAIGAILESEDFWPPVILAAGKAGGDNILDSKVGAELARRGVFALSYREWTDEDMVKHYELSGLDKHGVVDPWAQAVIKAKTSGGEGSSLSTHVPEGGTIDDHRLRFAVDDDYNGITEVGDMDVKVRASACVWAAGRDGKFGTADDLKSWTPGQVVD